MLGGSRSSECPFSAEREPPAAPARASYPSTLGPINHASHRNLISKMSMPL